MNKINDKDIAKEVGVAPCFFSRILNCLRPCPVTTAKKLEEVTGEDIRIWIFGSREEKRAAIKRYKQSEKAINQCNRN